MRRLIMDFVSAAEQRIAPLELERRIADAIGGARLTRRSISAIVRRELKTLINNGELSYTYEFGVSYIEQSFMKPVHIGQSLTLIPAGTNFFQESSRTVIRLSSGSCFGNGRHPTTRLAMQGIELVLKQILKPDGTVKTMLDIGTGSGILALTALALGFDMAAGLDTDPCSRYESTENASINLMKNRFCFIDKALLEIVDEFDLVTANLRYPSLVSMVKDIHRLTKPCGIVVLSGIRPEEFPIILDVWSHNGFALCWNACEKNWVGTAMQKIEETSINKH